VACAADNYECAIIKHRKKYFGGGDENTIKRIRTDAGKKIIVIYFKHFRGAAAIPNVSAFNIINHNSFQVILRVQYDRQTRA
jgi:hypothetical protein